MTIDGFIPQLWAARLLENLNKALVYGSVCNRDYEGQIRNMGDSVKILTIGPITISNFTKNTNLSAPETLTDAETTLIISQGKTFNFQVDDVDRAQQSVSVMEYAMQQAAYGLADAADQYIASLWSDIPTANQIGTSSTGKTDVGTAGYLYQYLVDLGTLLTQQNVPTGGRWVVLPPWAYGLLQKDSRFVANGTPQNMDILMNGNVGMAAGFTVLVSNNVPYTTTTTNFKIVAGYRGAITFAEQINKVEAYRPELRFADAIKGLHLYGAKVVRPAGLAVLFADRPS